MQHSALYPTIYVLGNGQLGRMLTYAGRPLDIDVQPLAFDGEPINLPENCRITAEIERWPDTPLTQQLSQHAHFINRSVFGLLADRFSQKSLLDQLALPTSPWQLVKRAEDFSKIFQQIGEKLVVKRRTGGYDGRGQWIINAHNLEQLSEDLFGEIIAEAFIPFDSEISLVGARLANGETRFYPISHNLQQQGILRYSLASPKTSPLQAQAEAMLAKIMHHLEYVGVMAMECFVVGDKLLINELAPRVHNSGHWTQLGANISQFELHLRALLGLPIPKLQIKSPTVMVNLIGTEHNVNWLKNPLAQLHWYGKEVRPARKVGHINLMHCDIQLLSEQLDTLAQDLPQDYQSGLAWTQEKLKEI